MASLWTRVGVAERARTGSGSGGSRAGRGSRNSGTKTSYSMTMSELPTPGDGRGRKSSDPTAGRRLRGRVWRRFNGLKIISVAPPSSTNPKYATLSGITSMMSRSVISPHHPRHRRLFGIFSGNWPGGRLAFRSYHHLGDLEYNGCHRLCVLGGNNRRVGGWVIDRIHPNPKPPRALISRGTPTRAPSILSVSALNWRTKGG